MAGITYLLEKHLNKPSFSRAFVRESIEAFEAVGPWFLTLLCLAAMGVTVQILTNKIPILFYLTLTYASALSLIIASTFHTMLTRYMADEIFKVNYHAIINSLISVTLIVIVISLVLSGLLICFSDVGLSQKIAFVMLTVVFSLFWCTSACLASLQKERILLLLFAMGVVIILSLFHVSGTIEPMPLTLIFSLGIAIPVAGGYAYTIKLYADSRIEFDWNFLRRNDALFNGFSLFLFYIGFWVDKFIFWFTKETGIAYDGLFHYCPGYDYPFFIALTFMMLGSVFVYRGMKRKISGPYKAFIFKIENNFPFREIALEKYQLLDGINQVSISLLMFYGGIALILLFLIHLGVIPLPWANPFVFHYLLVGTVFYSLYFFYFLVLQYLDEYRVLMRINFLFLLTNLFGTLISIQAGFKYHGTGFLAASVICSVVSFLILSSKVGGLEYYVFMKGMKQTTQS